ncbi:HK97 family phage portal protein [Bradyrhizobium sp. AZCC 1578]|uniref:phage portal protein n=1 Tax=Bradyrhizobium sp. AZCC 1578 TaxID=3117027 RepID=UPI002FF0DED9
MFGFTWFKKSHSLTDPRLSELFGFTPTLSGQTVTAATALHVPAVNAAVRIISESVAALPAHVLKFDGTSKILDKGNTIYRLIHNEPNGWTSSYDFRLQIQVDVLLHGNGYAFVNRVAGTPRELIRLAPTSVTVAHDQSSGEPVYTVTNSSGIRRTAPYSDIIHIKAISIDGVTGIAPIHHAREAIALALALEGHAAKLLGNGARPSGILKFKSGKLTREQLDRIKAAWQAAHGSGASGGTAVFDQDADFTPLTFNSVDMQFVELRRMQIVEISRAFRVPPHLLSELGRATWGNAAEMGQAFLDYTLMPWVLQWQAALTRALFAPEERATTSIELDTSALTRANLTARTEAYAKSVGGPFLTANEARALENRPPIEGGDILIPANDNNQLRKTKVA